MDQSIRKKMIEGISYNKKYIYYLKNLKMIYTSREYINAKNKIILCRTV